MVGKPKGIRMSEKSAFRPGGNDLAEFYNSTGWAFYVKLA
jgi:hypothetical protein